MLRRGFPLLVGPMKALCIRGPGEKGRAVFLGLISQVKVMVEEEEIDGGPPLDYCPEIGALQSVCSPKGQTLS